MRRRFDNLTTCIWLVYSCHGRLWDQRLKESGLDIREFIERDEHEQKINRETPFYLPQVHGCAA